MKLMMPKQGTLERIFLDAMVNSPHGVTFLDFIGTGITEENIDQLAQNLRNGMFEGENDNQLEFDA